MSYNLDFECLLASDDVCQQVCQESTEDLCSEPSFGSPPVVAILLRTYTFQAFVAEECSSTLIVFREVPPAAKPDLLLPVGLRAPPHFSA
jgi:hypothetical protein